MSSGRQTLWNALVWALVPFILGAGMPQMQCRCAAAKGQRWCECCFQKPIEPQPAKLTHEKPCCQRRLAKLQSEQPPALKTAAGCQACHSHKNPTTGSCCDLKSSDAPTLSKQVEPLRFDMSFIGVPTSVWQPELTSRLDEMWLGRVEQRTLDRVVVFAHLLI